MGKRQKRIFQPQLRTSGNEYLNRVANVILKDGRTLHGTPQQLEGEELLVKDMRQKVHRLAVTDIAEVVIDFEAPY